MSTISGIDNEYEFVRYLNNKKISNLNPMFRALIGELYPLENENSIIKCWRNHFAQKSDILIKINDLMKGLSLKKGIKNSIHVERISDFIHFLIENNVNRDTVIEYLKYHYADGSTNGTGKDRLSINDYKEQHQLEIDKINLIFNNENLLENAIDRFVIKGNNSSYYIDALIYGEVSNFVWITKSDIKEIIMSKKDLYSSAVHFGPLTCQPKNRCLNYNAKYEKDRFCVQIKWYNLFDDIIEHMNNKVLKERRGK